MTLRLSTGEVEKLRATARILASPFEHKGSAEWRRAVCESVQLLLPGSRASMFLVCGGDALWAGDADAATVLNASWPPPDWSYDAVQSRISPTPQVADWTELYDPAAVRRTEFYNEIVRPYRLWAPLTLFVRSPRSDVPAFLGIYFDQEASAFRSLERRRSVVSLLGPSFEAGVSSLTQVAGARGDLITLSERLQIGVAVCGLDGRLIHRNGALAAILSMDQDRTLLSAQIVRLAIAVGALIDHRALESTAEFPEPHPLSTDVHTRMAVYRITAIPVVGLWSGIGAAALALVDTTSPATPRAEDLMALFSLTPREAEVARLLLDGHGTREIAIHLRIAVNTARRHLEHILDKVGAHSRAEAVVRLSGSAPKIADDVAPTCTAR